ncbi:hypothetical protein LEP1GSC068_1996 [Leptospira sp. Fiocruz LV3954]|uniref:Uncharacterized protein n=1 Tax=Leptospira santarosai TaxID=28183 RepID=A0AB73M2W8_9LEPT|nr:hypothetical protein LEP1GSC068_1996 [Leptospira sp. Fiocruz LV3954]EMI69127.1 hypothetical protein LEP1GSC076_2720 [Leptospira sp. Fiocruz LV4135]ONF91288.1 hypothetical protein BWD14_17720 [Leptospira santarosai]
MNKIYTYSNIHLYDQKVIFPLLKFYKSNYIPFLFSGKSKKELATTLSQRFSFLLEIFLHPIAWEKAMHTTLESLAF